MYVYMYLYIYIYVCLLVVLPIFQEEIRERFLRLKNSVIGCDFMTSQSL